MAWEYLPHEDRKGFRVLPCRRLVARAFGGSCCLDASPAGQLVTASMIIATVMNLLHFRGKNQQIHVTCVDLGRTDISPRANDH